MKPRKRRESVWSSVEVKLCVSVAPCSDVRFCAFPSGPGTCVPFLFLFPVEERADAFQYHHPRPYAVVCGDSGIDVLYEVFRLVFALLRREQFLGQAQDPFF